MLGVVEVCCLYALRGALFSNGGVYFLVALCIYFFAVLYL